MSSKKYIWTPGSEPPPIEPHSKTKHEILKDYLIHYLKIRTLNPRVKYFHLTLIDGFAGGGQYTYQNDIVPGSPLIMLDAVKEAQISINVERKTKSLQPLRIRPYFWFVEKDKNVFQYLKNSLEEREHDPIGYKLVNGEFTHKSTQIIDSIKQTRASTNCIFVLDQYGYTDVLFSSIANIFHELPKAEVILTFAVDHLINFLTEKNNTSSKLLANLGLNKDTSKRLLEQAGNKENKLWRKRIQYLLHRELPQMSGASYYTPFFITSPKSSRSYWLLHFSMHPRAREAMMSIHWEKDNSFAHYGGAGLEMLGYTPKQDSSLSAQGELGYNFDEEAKNRTIEKLSSELPEEIHRRGGNTTFEDLYKNICNGTTADEKIMKEALKPALGSGDIEIRGSKGEKRRKSNAIKNEDRISLPIQRRLFFIYNKSY